MFSSRMVLPLLSVIMSLLLQACGPTEEAFKKGFKEEFDKSCIESAAKSGGNLALVTKVCTCTSDKLTQNHSMTELLELRNPESPKSKKLLQDTIEACTEDLQKK